MTTSTLIVMGVSGCGKTTLGRALSDKLFLPFVDADDYHPPSNITKMSSGEALTDADRQPWLETLARLLAAEEKRAGAILACSALKAAYRQTLTQQLTGLHHFVHLVGDAATILGRMQARSDHFMPPELLASQFETLEVPSDAWELPITWSLADQVEFVVNHLTA